MSFIYKTTTIMGILTLLCDSVSLAQTDVTSRRCQISAYVIDEDPQELNVRTSPSSSSAIIDKLPVNTEVEVLASQGNWMLVSPLASDFERIKFQERGWVYAPLLGISTRGYDRDSVSVFADTSYLSAVVGQIPSDRQVKLLDCQGQWALVEKQGIRGWLPPNDQCAAALTTCP